MTPREIAAAECRRAVAPTRFPFASTADVTPLHGIASQERALTALSFGLDIRQPRFHVVAVGASGTGRTFCARSIARRLAAERPTPDDLLLLPNANRPSEPTLLMLPAGEGRPFVEAMDELHARIVEAVSGTVEGERWKQVRRKLERRTGGEEARLEQRLREQAAQIGFELSRSEQGIEVSAVTEAEPSAADLQAITAAVEEFEAALAHHQATAEEELRATLRQLLAEAVRGCFAPVCTRFDGRADLASFLARLETVVQREVRGSLERGMREGEWSTLARGVVVPTLLTSHAPGSGAPIVEVPYPTVTALFGRSYAPPDSGFPPEPGFALAGALHQANGGFLLLPAGALLKNEVLYEQLKACLLAGKLLVPEHNDTYYRASTEELLFPPMPIDVKVILVAEPNLYQELHAADPDFSQIFKVQARFESTMSLEEAVEVYPPFLAGVARDRGLPPLTADAVSELIFHGGRLAESQDKVTAQLGLIAEVAIEAGYRARRSGKPLVDGAEVLAALASARRRGSHFRDSVHELLAEGTIRIDVTGGRIGQVNAVAVLSDGPVIFGKPCRVTASTFAGVEGPINIAREVAMSGPLHSKGVLVVTGFLAHRFAQTRPLTFGASLVFEQVYEAIDGDSASSTELYALLSALAGLPIRQDLAVTGSVDQQGSLQPVGGINEKIESFYDLCAAKGLTGTQGVLIPEANRSALMLRDDVVRAIDEGRFHVHQVATVEQGIELLTGVPAGAPNDEGHYPPDTVFGAVERTLGRYHEIIARMRHA